MTAKEDTKQVPYFPLVPVGSVIDPYTRWYGRNLICVRLDPDSRLVCDGEKVINDLKKYASAFSVDNLSIVTHLETEIPRRIINRCDIHDGFVLTLRVISKKCQDGYDRLRGDIDRKFILVDGELLDEFRQASGEVLAILMKW